MEAQVVVAEAEAPEVRVLLVRQEVPRQANRVALVAARARDRELAPGSASPREAPRVRVPAVLHSDSARGSQGAKSDLEADSAGGV